MTSRDSVMTSRDSTSSKSVCFDKKVTRERVHLRKLKHSQVTPTGGSRMSHFKVKVTSHFTVLTSQFSLHSSQ